MRTIKILFIPLFLIISLFARPYTVPLGSSDNTISLTINNQGMQDIQELHVVPENIHEFIEINQLDNSNSIKAGQTGIVKYSFTIKENAKIDSLIELKFNITGDKSVNRQKIIPIRITAPEKFELYDNYPNPFNPVTNIKYTLPEKSKVNLSIYNLTGQRVQTLVQKSQEAGIYTQKWNASNLASGVYFYRIKIQNSAGIKTETRKMLLVK